MGARPRNKMGDEVELRHEGTVLRGRLAHDERGLVFEGENRQVVIERASIHDARDEGGMVAIRTTRGLYTFSLGDLGKLWEARVRDPRAVAEKLLVEPSHRAALLGDDSIGLGSDLVASGATMAAKPKAASVDRVVLVVDGSRAIGLAKDARALLATDGILWLVARAKPEGFREIDALLALRKEGLRDSRAIKLTDAWKATRFSPPRGK